MGRCVRGASHKRSGKECQDSRKNLICDDGTVIMAVADGHGSDSCPFSKTGSAIAAAVFCGIMRELYSFYKDKPLEFMTYLNREGNLKVAQSIERKWKECVLRAHAKRAKKYKKTPKKVLFSKSKSPEDIYKMYGTTLIGALTTPSFIFTLQIGDGDITLVNKNGASVMMKSEKFLGTESNSLCKRGAWKKFATAVHGIQERAEESLLILSTDGFSNSYKNDEAFHNTCKSYFDAIKEYGSEAVNENLGQWLEETSEMGCGDDITLQMLYFSPE